MLAPAADRQVARTDNQPAAVAIVAAKEAGQQIGRFLEDTPVIETLEQARAGATQMRLGTTALKDMEDERTSSPQYLEWKALDTKVKGTNKIYKSAMDALNALIRELDKRIWRYREAEKERKRQEAEAAKRKAEEAQRQAEQAAFARDEALNDAQAGVSADVGSLIVDAEQLERRAGISTQIAEGLERNAEVVRIRDTFGGRALADRNPDVPTVTDAVAAVTAIGLTAKIEQAIISSARDFYKAHGEWPEGITLVKQRELEA